ncbi:FecR family protein [Ancylomarina sp. 16SWW S1-10-2]|uniref:FecR family protein n=1 Tax=Ancylomarina sp. 16SWW S1-10-2 TaxID=2499681 RepID=UPI0012AE20FA|nr:FecR family protein [Ancylomarina sp. 16SWW S1-10-2]MRT93025.1 FecR family protein [Ancylomarina sp. 16SWW S1-10-2]
MKITTELLTDYLNKQSNEATNKEIEAWIKREPKNKRYFEELQFYWHNEPENSRQIEFDTEEALKSIQNKRAAKKQFRFKKLLRYAAVITLLIATSITSYIFVSTDFNKVIIENQMLSEKSVELPDGSKILLAQGSTLSYSKSFNEKERLVQLSGEAFFNVSKDKTRPFIITTKRTKTRVLGTSFRISEENSYTNITVYSGIVEFMENLNTSNKVKLLKGESARFFERTKVLLSKNNQTSNQEFRVKHLEYKNAKLETICKDFKEIFNTDIKLGNDRIKELRISTTFENQNFENILQSICFSLDLDIEKNNDHILLK